MKRLGFDTETYLISRETVAPKMVCATFCDEDGDKSLWLREDTVPLLHAFFDSGVEFVAHHARFDMAVAYKADPTLLPAIMQAYDEDRVRCSMVREKILALARGELADEGETGAKRNIKFSLSATVMRHFEVDLSAGKKGADSWRLRYSELDNIPVEQWPAEARDYALDDAAWPLAVFDSQTAQFQAAGGVGNALPDEHHQTRAAFWLYLLSMRGVRTDIVRVNALSERLTAEYERINALVRAADVLRPKMEKGQMVWSRNMKAIRARVSFAYDGKPPKTPGGKTRGPEIKTDRDTLTEIAEAPVIDWIEEQIEELPKMTGEEAAVTTYALSEVAAAKFGKEHEQVYNWMVLKALGERSGVEKVLNTYVPVLYSGTQLPIHPSYNELVATGRSSSYEPNLQNPPTKGGVRECFIPRDGHYFAFCDYSFIELCTLAQICLWMFGRSTLADAINDGLDPHLAMAAEDLDISYAEAKRRLAAGDPEIVAQRQRCKARNFGFPGGLGPDTYVAYARGYGVNLTRHAAKQEKEKWYRKWPEMRDYHQYFSDRTLGGRTFTLVQQGSGRVRGGVGFCDGANSGFQGLAADGIKRAGWNITKECYLRDPYRNGAPPTALYGSAPVLFLHDELILEVPVDTAHEAAHRLSEVMISGMREVVPDVKVSTEFAIASRWYKGAKPVFVNGRLAPWEPKKKSS